MKVHVICCNDSVKFAVIKDKRKANSKMEELRAADFERHKGMVLDEAEYKVIYYWHIHTVEGA